MAQEVKTIKVDNDVDLAEVLDVARSRPVRLEKDGVTYTLTRDEEDMWAGYDPDKVLAAIDAMAGTITPEEGERWKQAVYRARKEGSRSADRP